MTISIQEMKDILSTAMQNNSNSNLSDCINTDFDCNNLHNTIIGNYPLIGFECAVFVPLDEHYNYFEDQFLDYWIEVTTEYKNNTIKAFCSAGNGKHELLSESVDTSSIEAFKVQCEKFVSAL